MKKIFKTLKNYLISLRNFPVKTLKLFLFNVFIKYIYRTIIDILITALFGNSLFDNDIISSIEKTLKSLWNNIKYFTYNILTFVENRLRDFLSWITNSDFYKSNNKSSTRFPWPTGSNSKPSTPSIPPRESFDEYQSRIKKLKEENWRKTLDVHKPEGREPGWSLNPFGGDWSDPYQWLKLGLLSMATAGVSFAVFYNWDTITTFVQNWNF